MYDNVPSRLFTPELVRNFVLKRNYIYTDCCILAFSTKATKVERLSGATWKGHVKGDME